MKVLEMKELAAGVFIAGLLVTGVSCKKQCELKPKDGFEIVGDDKDCEYVEVSQPEPCVDERRNEAAARDSLNYWQNQKELACVELQHVVDSLSAIDPDFANAIIFFVESYGPLDSLPMINAIIRQYGEGSHPLAIRLCGVARKAKQAWESYLAWLEKHEISTALLEDCQRQNGSR